LFFFRTIACRLLSDRTFPPAIRYRLAEFAALNEPDFSQGSVSDPPPPSPPLLSFLSRSISSSVYFPFPGKASTSPFPPPSNGAIGPEEILTADRARPSRDKSWPGLLTGSPFLLFRIIASCRAKMSGQTGFFSQ